MPVAVDGGLQFAYIKAGELFTCGVTSEGAASCWDDNEYGQLGDGSFTGGADVPVQVAFQPNGDEFDPPSRRAYRYRITGPCQEYVCR
ncbi:MAG TPA: RCC1 domain-containing protein [Gemmatimonadales bacterium]